MRLTRFLLERDNWLDTITTKPDQVEIYIIAPTGYIAGVAQLMAEAILLNTGLFSKMIVHISQH